MKPKITLLLLLTTTCLSANLFSQANVDQQTEFNHYSILNKAKDELLREAKVYYKDAKGVSRAITHDDISQFAIGFFQKTLQQE